MDEEFNLSLSPTRKPESGPRQGRRAGAFTSGPSFEAKDAFESESVYKSRPISGDIFLEENGTVSKKNPPNHGRRTGGWADESARAKTAKSLKFGGSEVAGGFGRADSDDDDGPAIPDLDDVQDEDMALQIADAPTVAVNRVDTYKELDNDLLKHVAYATLDDIDLRLLTRCMAPEQALKEPDETWTWDIIFAEVSGELQKEWFPDQEEIETQKDGKTNHDRPYTAFNRFPV